MSFLKHLEKRRTIYAIGNKVELANAEIEKTIQYEMNFSDAVSQLEGAARAGHGKAAMFLAELYYQGFRVERDSLKAQFWQNLATMQA